MDKRSFLRQIGLATAAGATGALAACTTDQKVVNGPYINFNQTYRWKMTTTWPPNFPILGTGCKLFAELVGKMSGGRMEITVYGGGELIPPLEGFDAVSSGAVEMNHGASYYWAGKAPATQFFCAVPFGMNAQQMQAWLVSGGGQALWEGLYAPFDLLPLMCGNTGLQTGGWFNKEIRSMDDLKGLKMRIPGLGGKVFAQAGGTPVTVAGGEIYTNLERGVIDAAEWVGPYHDYLMGFHEVAKYYYYPGWQEPGPVLELILNKSKFESLPSDLQQIIRAAAFQVNTWMMTESDTTNGIYLQKIIDDQRATVRAFPDEVIAGLRQATEATIQELVSRDAWSQKVYEHAEGFKKKIRPWMEMTEKIYHEKIA